MMLHSLSSAMQMNKSWEVNEVYLHESTQSVTFGFRSPLINLHVLCQSYCYWYLFYTTLDCNAHFILQVAEYRIILYEPCKPLLIAFYASVIRNWNIYILIFCEMRYCEGVKQFLWPHREISKSFSYYRNFEICIFMNFLIWNI